MYCKTATLNRPQLSSSSSASGSAVETTTSSVGTSGGPFVALRRWRFRSQGFDAVGTAGGDATAGEVAGIHVSVEVAVCQHWACCQPAGSDGTVAAKQVQPSLAEAEVFDDVEDFGRFFQ